MELQLVVIPVGSSYEDRGMRNDQHDRTVLKVYNLAVLKMIFNFVLGPPSPGGPRGRVRSAIFLRNSEVFRPIPARIRWGFYFPN